MENKKLIPLGIDDFKDVIENCYYVDKTKLIKDIVREPPSSAILFTRPRRFGKSLALSMIKSFFENGKIDKTYLFENTYIYKDKTIMEKYFMKFPVVYLNFKNALGTNKDYLLTKTHDIVKEEYKRHEYLLDSDKLSIEEKQYFSNISKASISETDLSSSLSNLTKFLHLHFDKRVIILIDEYDTPLRYAYENGYYEEVINIYKSLFGEALKSNEHLYYAILTGILQVSKESIFSGLNNLLVNTILDASMDEGFGFNENEVIELLKYYGLIDKLDEFKEWYDGYLFGNAKIYNPLSVLSAIKNNGEIGPYWSNTSEKSALYSLAKKSSFSLTNLSSLLSSNTITSSIDLAISYLDIDTSPSFLNSYLLATGYLSVEKKLSFDRYILRLPNKEINSVFEKEIIHRYLPEDKEDLPSLLKKAFYEADPKSLEYLLKNYLLTSFSYYEVNQEKNYQIMLASVLSIILKGYKIRNEVNSGNGRSDIIAIPSLDNEPGFIIETKLLKGKVSSKRLSDSSISAIKQIENKGYIVEFNSTKVKEVIYLGMSFSNRSVKVSVKKVSLTN